MLFFALWIGCSIGYWVVAFANDSTPWWWWFVPVWGQVKVFGESESLGATNLILGFGAFTGFIAATGAAGLYGFFLWASSTVTYWVVAFANDSTVWWWWLVPIYGHVRIFMESSDLGWLSLMLGFAAVTGGLAMFTSARAR